MSNPERARRWLETSLAAELTGLKPAHRGVLLGNLAALESAYPDVREHAIAGTAADFDRPLSAELRAYQRELRQQEGFDGHDVMQLRRELRHRERPPLPASRPSPPRAPRPQRTRSTRPRRRARRRPLSIPTLGVAGVAVVLAVVMVVELLAPFWPLLLAGLALWLLRRPIAGGGRFAWQLLRERRHAW